MFLLSVVVSPWVDYVLTMYPKSEGTCEHQQIDDFSPLSRRFGMWRSSFVSEDAARDSVVLLLSFDGDVPIETIEALGWKVNSVYGGEDFGTRKSVASVEIPYSDYFSGAYLSLPNLQKVDVPKRVYPMLDVAFSYAKFPIFLAKESLSIDYQKEQNLVFGIVDTGVDWTHPAFWDKDGSRIIYYWDQEEGGTGAGTGYTYGTLYTKDDLDSKNGPEGDIVGHGTHVAGIIGGFWDKYRYNGVARGAKFIVVRAKMETSSTVLDAVEFCAQKMKEMGARGAINVSLGTLTGPHDGTSSDVVALDNIVSTYGYPVVLAAGNEGDWGYHASIESINSTNSGCFTLQVEDAQNYSLINVDIWFEGQNLTLTIKDPSGDSHVIAPSASGYAITDSDAYINATNKGEVDSDNGAVNIAVILYNFGTSSGEWNFTFSPSLGSSGSSRLDAWIEPFYCTANLAPRDPLMTLSDFATGKNTIVVSAFVTKSSWSSYAGTASLGSDYKVGEVAPFSSAGPTRDGRKKPEVAAPGAAIVSALSSQAASSFGDVYKVSDGDGYYLALFGTSMASPFVTAFLGLLSLSGKDVSYFKSKISSNSWDPHLGYVKLDASYFSGSVPLVPKRYIFDRHKVFIPLIPSESSGYVRVRIFDITGKLVHQGHAYGEASYRWKDASPGIFVVKISSSSGSRTVEVIVK